MARIDKIRHTFALLWAVSITITVCGQQPLRHWTVADGLPTGEVQQIIELPNGQMLINCEGIFCLSTGQAFISLSYDHSRAYRIEADGQGYAYLWQGDSLLWLRDFYCLHLFDVRSRAFRYDITAPAPLNFKPSTLNSEHSSLNSSSPSLRAIVDSLHLAHFATVAIRDRRGGIWIGTWQDGIYYLPPVRNQIQYLSRDEAFALIGDYTTDSDGRQWKCTPEGLVCNDHGIHTRYDQTNVPTLPHQRMTFIVQLPDGRHLLCCDLNQLGYFTPPAQFVSLNERIPQLNRHRHFIDACPIDERWTAIYSQNGAYLLDTQADTLAPFPCQRYIENYSNKYNCIITDHKQRIWVGTQNGLFCITPTVNCESSIVNCQLSIVNCQLSNNCIRSLVEDRNGTIWVGTAYGISALHSALQAAPPPLIPASEPGPHQRPPSQDLISGLLAENYGPDDGSHFHGRTTRSAASRRTNHLHIQHCRLRLPARMAADRHHRTHGSHNTPCH